MKLLEYMEKGDYEQVVYCCDREVGLKAIIAIHDTTLGPALGGARIWNYSSEEEALVDVLRLAKSMTYKAAVSGLNLGGGKAAVIGIPPEEKREALFRSLGAFIESLGGRYITTEDVGTRVKDMEYMSTRTSYVTGLPLHLGGSGDPSPHTAVGIVAALRACAEKVYGSPSLKGKKVAIQGLGKVGYHLVALLVEEKAEIIGCDVNKEAEKRATRDFGIKIVEPEVIHKVDCDILSPCALGGVLNSQTIPEMKCRIICGGANNQLLEDSDIIGELVASRGILYAPDYVANAGGLINLSFELTGYDARASEQQVKKIYDTMKRIIEMAGKRNITTARAANLLAEERIANARKGKKIKVA